MIVVKKNNFILNIMRIRALAHNSMNERKSEVNIQSCTFRQLECSCNNFNFFSRNICFCILNKQLIMNIDENSVMA